MVSIESVEKDILELEQRDTTYTNLTRLQPLYTAVIYDYIKNNHIEKNKPLDVQGTSDFLKAVSGKNSAAVWAVMDELMKTIQVLHPKVYTSVMSKIKSI